MGSFNPDYPINNQEIRDNYFNEREKTQLLFSKGEEEEEEEAGSYKPNLIMDESP